MTTIKIKRRQYRRKYEAINTQNVSNVKGRRDS